MPISAFSPLEVSHLITNAIVMYFFFFIVPLQTVGLFLLVIGLSIVIMDRIRNYHEKKSQNIITGLLAFVEISSLFLLGMNIKDIILPLLSLMDNLKKEGYTPGMLIPLDKFFPSSFIDWTLWSVLWFLIICFFLIFYFYLIWQKNVSTIGRFFILTGYLLFFISAGIFICLGFLKPVVNFLGFNF